MNSRVLVLALFVAWSGLCWRWYVCGVKEVCNADAASKKSDQVMTPNPPEKVYPQDTVDNTIQPISKPVESPEIKKETTKSANNTAVKKEKTTGTKPKPAAPTTSSATTTVSVKDLQVVESAKAMTIRFPTNSIRPDDVKIVDAYLTKLAARMKKSGESISITGHTDFVGEPEDNVILGQKRAQSIKDVLVKKGVSAAKIKCYSKGDKLPASSNDTPEGRFKNRRVEIKTL
jgi:outer membrane protein OmpA-like peptidoglycan-associated protein